MIKPDYNKYTDNELVQAFVDIDDEKHSERANEILSLIEFRGLKFQPEFYDSAFNKLVSTITIFVSGYDFDEQKKAVDIKVKRVNKRRLT